jgi:uncharacterized protein (TIGR00369 family)
MKIPNPKHAEKLISLVNGCPYFTLISMRIVEIGLGYARLEIDLAKKHLQPFGLVHGGVFATIIDSAASWALFYGIEDHDAGLTSVDLKLNYLAPAVAGKLIARGRQIKIGKTLGYAEAEVADQTGKMVAHGTSTIMILPGKSPVADLSFPPKFME